MLDAQANAPVAEVRDLKVYFNAKQGIVHAVDGVSFEIRDGETLGLVGETGCGKSVTGRAFLRLLPVPPGILAGGSVTFRSEDGESHDLLTLGDAAIREIRGNRIAMIFQDPGKALNPTLTVGQQVGEVFLQHRSDELLERAGLAGEGGAIRRYARQSETALDRVMLKMPGLRGKRARLMTALNGMVAEALAATQVPNPAKLIVRFPHELSGGMRQRVMIAQALACNPDLLIADEPTTALDVTVEARILELIRDLQAARGTSVLYISHDLSLVRRICDRTAVMYAGRIVEIGDSGELFRNPRHPYTRGLLNAVPSAQAERGGLAAIRGTVPELIDPPAACRFASRCPYATALCHTRDPALAVVESGHKVACFIDHPQAGAEAPSYDRVTET